MRKRLFRVVAVAIAVTLLGSIEAGAMSLIAATDAKCTDVIAAPDDFYSWDPGTITWKMDAEFLDTFPHPSQQNQVRLAFKEWATASTSDSRRHALAPYSFVRWNGERPFYDLRSVLAHELGHALGSQHPDACWFNVDGDTGLPFHANFKPDGDGGWVAGPPSGGEIMNEGNGPGLPDEKPAKGLNGGEYWRIVSKDELRMLDYAYGHGLEFQEVFGSADADIVVSVHNVDGPPSTNLGIGGPDASSLRVPGDASQGRRITAASVSLNANPGTPIDLSARKTTWEFTNNTGKSVTEMSLGIFGTDNRTPISVSSTGAHRFTVLSPVVTTTPFKPERLGRRLTNPVGGSIPPGATIQVGLEEDVWDWELQTSNVRASDGTIFPSNLVTVLGFGFAAAGQGSSGAGATAGAGDLQAGLSQGGGGTSAVSGFRIRNADSPVTISELTLAVPPSDLGLAQLNSATLAELRGAGKAVPVRIDPIELGPGEELLFVLAGDASYLPEEVRRRGNFRVLDRPDLAERELMVFTRATGRGSSVGAFSLVNDERLTFDQVAVDVNPGVASGAVSCAAGATVSAAILSTPAFDAVKVDPATVRLGSTTATLGAGGAPSSQLTDVDGDGDRDLLVRAAFAQTGLTCDHDRVTVSARTLRGGHLSGHERVTMLRS